MTMETLASFHVIGNIPSQYMSDDLSHLQGCSAAALQQRLIWSYTEVCKSQHFLHYKCWGEIARDHSGLNHPSGLRPPV